MVSTAAALVFVALTVVVAEFQVALCLGMPWGAAFWGGKYPGKLPSAMRVVSLFFVDLLLGFVLVVVSHEGLALPTWRPFAAVGIWIVMAYLTLGTIANTFTPSHWERIIWLPVTAAMLLCTILVAYEAMRTGKAATAATQA